MAQFDIYTANIRHTDDASVDYRPILQLKSNTEERWAFCTISKNIERNWRTDVRISDLKAAHLNLPSVARLSERLSNKPSKMRKIGHLAPIDIANVLRVLNTPHKVYSHVAEELDDDFSIQSILNEVIHD